MFTFVKIEKVIPNCFVSTAPMKKRVQFKSPYISIILEEDCGCTCTTLATTLRGGETKQRGTLNYDRLYNI